MARDDYYMGSLAGLDAYRGDEPAWPDARGPSILETAGPRREFGSYLEALPPRDPSLWRQAKAGSAEGLAGHLAHKPYLEDLTGGDPGTRELQQAYLGSVAEGVPKPEGAGGRYTRSIMGAVANPSSYMGVGPGTGLAWAVGSGAGSEFLGNQYKDTAAEPWARAVGGLTPAAPFVAWRAAGHLPQGSVGAFGGKIIQPQPETSLGELAKPFYSAAEQAVTTSPLTKAPPEQWLGTLRNTPGVKADELERLGLEQFLRQQQGAVPKQALADYVAANKVDVEEVRKGASLEPPGEQAQIQAKMRQLERARREGAIEADPFNEQMMFLDMKLERLMRAGEGGGVAEMPTKFQQWQLPGGENYRETLLTMPGKKVEPSLEEIEHIAKTRYEGYHRQENDPPWERIAPDVQRLYREDANAKIIAAESHPQFTAGHFTEPNVLVHYRTNDRTIDGKKTLFLEEVQSDWHQKGREQGYAGAPETAVKRALTAEEARRVGLPEGAEQYVVERNGRIIGSGDTAEEARLYANTATPGVPDAPFKTTWHELALKRAIRDAAEGGYDQIAWTPGSVQAQRYPDALRQVVSDIGWSQPSGSGPRYIHAKPQAGGVPLHFTVDENGLITAASNNGAIGKKVEDMFGKDMAKQIMSKSEGDIAGKDFIVGGKYLRELYDTRLPSAANKLGKKHGAQVGQASMHGRTSLYVHEYVDPYNGRPAFEVRNRETGGDVVDMFATRAEADRLVDQGKTGGQVVHTLPITPSLRETALRKGFPLFVTGGVTTMGALAAQDRYANQ